MIRRIKDTHGFYTLEAAIILPLVILAVISIGYYIRIYAIWENCMYGALDESSYTVAVFSDGVSAFSGKSNIRNRLKKDNPRLTHVEVTSYLTNYSDLYADSITSYGFTVGTRLSLPLDFGHASEFKGAVKYRGFVGVKNAASGMGAEALETEELKDPVYIFPQYGEKYHGAGCTYVEASVKSYVLSNRLKRNYSACGLCKSGDMAIGSVVFCFKGEDTAYHRGTCKSIKRHPAVVNRSEAESRGYSPCTKCGGN